MLYEVGIIYQIMRGNMSIEENLKVVRLIDVYGSTLTDKQFSIVTSYYFDNLTLSEIGENNGISRQAVSDCIAQALKSMRALEEKLGVISREETLQTKLTEFSNSLPSGDRERLQIILEEIRR